jgi:hypothetical protein
MATDAERWYLIAFMTMNICYADQSLKNSVLAVTLWLALLSLLWVRLYLKLALCLAAVVFKFSRNDLNLVTEMIEAAFICLLSGETVKTDQMISFGTIVYENIGVPLSTSLYLTSQSCYVYLHQSL